MALNGNGRNGSGAMRPLIIGVLAAAGMTVVGVIVIGTFGGSDSNEATNALLLIMAPIITGMMTMLVAISTRAGQAHAEGVAEERKIGAERAADVAVATAEVVADAAEQRVPVATSTEAGAAAVVAAVEDQTALVAKETARVADATVRVADAAEAAGPVKPPTP